MRWALRRRRKPRAGWPTRTSASCSARLASAVPRPRSGKGTWAGGRPSTRATRAASKCFASSSARCQARMPGPAIRSPTTSGVWTTTRSISAATILQARQQSFGDAPQRRPPAYEELHVFPQKRGDASDAAVHPRDEVAVARAQPLRVLAEDARGGGAAMRRFHDRQHDRAPPTLVQPRAKLDVFVVGEETRIERALANGGGGKEGGGGGDAESGFAIRDSRFVANLPNRPIRDIDPCPIDRAVGRAQHRLHRGDVVIHRCAHRLQPV